MQKAYLHYIRATKKKEEELKQQKDEKFKSS